MKMKAFDCKQCGKCCYGEGGIHVDENERDRIARFLGMSTESFIARYCEERNGRIYIKTGSDNFCVFFNKEKQCLIHPVKPEPCFEWPFYPAIVKDEDTWEGARDACPGFNPDCSFSEFVKQSKEK
jgi:Fe-S-cluster containining protein